jgi:hypothetical protein
MNQAARDRKKAKKLNNRPSHPLPLAPAFTHPDVDAAYVVSLAGPAMDPGYMVPRSIKKRPASRLPLPVLRRPLKKVATNQSTQDVEILP